MEGRTLPLHDHARAIGYSTPDPQRRGWTARAPELLRQSRSWWL